MQQLIAHYFLCSCGRQTSSAWCGFTNAMDHQKITAFIHCSIHTGFCSPDLADFYEFYISANEHLFKKILNCPDHILRVLLPSSAVWNYSLRKRQHNRKLPDRISRLTDCNFITRLLYHDAHFFNFTFILLFTLIAV